MANYFKLFSTNTNISYGKENDTIHSGFGDDFINAGLGKNFINSGFGNDTLVHDFASSANNTYFGGSGHDKVLLNISAEDLQREDVQQDLIAFAEHNQNSFRKEFVPFRFKSMDLTIKSVEEIEFNILEGNNDKATVDENNSIEVDVLANDTLTSGENISLVGADVVGGQGSVSIENGKVIFDSNGDFDYLNNGEQETVDIEYVIQDDVNGTKSSATLSVSVIGKSDVTASDVLIDNGGLYDDGNYDCTPEDIFGDNVPPEFANGFDEADNYTHCDPEDVLYGIDFKDTTVNNNTDTSYDCSPEDIYGANYIPEDVALNTTTFDVVI